MDTERHLPLYYSLIAHVRVVSRQKCPDQGFTSPFFKKLKIYLNMVN
jgi:hypothetical protein